MNKASDDAASARVLPTTGMRTTEAVYHRSVDGRAPVPVVGAAESVMTGPLVPIRTGATDSRTVAKSYCAGAVKGAKAEVGGQLCCPAGHHGDRNGCRSPPRKSHAHHTNEQLSAAVARGSENMAEQALHGDYRRRLHTARL